MITVAGDALMNVLVEPSGKVTALPGGAPFNVARTIARLGAACQFLGRLSDDGFGRRLRMSLEQQHVLRQRFPRSEHKAPRISHQSKLGPILDRGSGIDVSSRQRCLRCVRPGTPRGGEHLVISDRPSPGQPERASAGRGRPVDVAASAAVLALTIRAWPPIARRAV